MAKARRRKQPKREGAMTTRRAKRAAPAGATGQDAVSTTGQYVAEYSHESGVDGNRLQRVQGADVSEAKGQAEREAPKGFALIALYAQCWPNEVLDQDEEEDESEE
jgi:hypothetical protein